MSQESTIQATPPPVAGRDRYQAGANDGFELRVQGFQGTPEEIERQWFEEVYKGRGDTMKQLTQMIVGGLHPGSATTTLMSAHVVSSAAISSADLLTEIKSGYLLGAFGAWLW